MIVEVSSDHNPLRSVVSNRPDRVPPLTVARRIANDRLKHARPYSSRGDVAGAFRHAARALQYPSHRSCTKAASGVSGAPAAAPLDCLAFRRSRRSQNSP